MRSKALHSPWTPLRTIRVGEVLPLGESSARWLIEELWSARAVGVLGGPPKSCKTWLAVDLALSVASGTKALGRYSVREPGPVLFFAAEDALALIRERFEALSSQRGLALETLEVLLVDVPVLRLDREEDQNKLSETLRLKRPKLLVLDPLVRLHALEENSASEISGLLSFLRHLERKYEVAILVVHHTRKSAGGAGQGGQGLRGSSDIHAWGDSNLYLRRARDGLLLTVEHRSHPAPLPILVRLETKPLPHLEVSSKEVSEESADPFAEEVFWCLKNAPGPLRLEDLRQQLSVRKQRIVEALRELTDTGRVERSQEGFVCLRSPGED